MAKGKDKSPLDYMQLAVDVMKQSKQERRNDTKISPLVGAVLVKPDGEVVTAYRSELREGDHAEFTLIERKCRDQRLEGSVLFATLEPCAPGARHFPKLSCAERIVNARIKKVYVGIEDPDPSVARKGIVYLQEQGVEVEMFPSEFQAIIEEANADFLRQAEARARDVRHAPKEIVLSSIENVVNTATMESLDESLLEAYLRQVGVNESVRSGYALQMLMQAGVLAMNEKNEAQPTGIGVLLFGKNPQLMYPNAKVCATLVTGSGEELIKDITGPLLRQPHDVEEWLKMALGGRIDRSHAAHDTIYDYPMDVLREVVNNAILHRDYEIEGAAIQLRVTKEAITVMSPGGAVSPIKLEQLQDFSAPTLSRNPKIISAFNLFNISEQRGFGFSTIRELPTKHKLPLPMVTFNAPYIVTRLSKRFDEELYDSAMSEREKLALDFVRVNGKVTRKQYEEAMGIPKSTSNRDMAHLIELGYLDTEGESHSTRYFVTEKFRQRYAKLAR